MDDREVGQYWERNADAWTKLSRAGYDICRDEYNTPTFLDILPEVAGLSGLDIGCGEGTNTRHLARLGAKMTAIDISPTFIRHAREAEADAGSHEPIHYHLGSALALPFAEQTFDFATAFMCLMDMPDRSKALAEAWRVIKPGGFLQFSITHPCTGVPRRKKVKDAAGNVIALELAGYFDSVPGDVERWTFGHAPAELCEGVEPFAVPRFDATLSEWLNDVIAAGFQIEKLAEPRATAETLKRYPREIDSTLMPYFLITRCRKLYESKPIETA